MATNMSDTILHRAKVAAVGMSTFWVSLQCGHTLAGSLGVCASTAGFRGIVGLLTIAGSSVACSRAALLFEKYIVPDEHAFVTRTLTKYPQHVTDITIAVTGVLLFLGSNGKIRQVLPSNVSRLGAFHDKNGSIPARLDKYANKQQRESILKFGKQYGCHTCGTRSSSAQFHADHQPPVKQVKDVQESLSYKIFRYDTSQQFLPQCQSCSSIQSAAVRTGTKVLKYNYTSTLRFFHFTGLWIIVLCPFIPAEAFQLVRSALEFSSSSMCQS